MTNLQKILLRLSGVRQRLNEIAGLEGEALTEEIRTEATALHTEYGELETRHRAALVAESEATANAATQFETAADGEGAEFRALVAGANIGDIFAATVGQSRVEGQTAELQQHLGLQANAVPLALLRDPPASRIEHRAVTPAPADTGADQLPIVQPVFATGDAAFLMVDQRRVPVGDAVAPVLTSRPTVGGPHTDSTAVAETTGAFSADVLAPGRLQASFFYKQTDAARFAGMGEALRMALNSGLQEAVDAQVIAQIVTDVARTAVNAATEYDGYRTRLVYDRIDGRFAGMASDIRVLAGTATLSHMAQQHPNGDAISAADNVAAVAGGLKVSAHIPAVAANKQDAIVRRGMRPDFVAALWDGVRLIPDEVTKASTGEIVITAVLMAAFKTTRTGGFARVAVQHA